MQFFKYREKFLLLPKKYQIAIAFGAGCCYSYDNWLINGRLQRRH